MLHSDYQDLGPVELPVWQGRQRYMHTFDPAAPVMEEGFEDYFDTVFALCRAANIQTGEAHMTVDEKIVQSAMSQRRPGAHVDGRFLPTKGRWGHNDEPGGSWAHYCNRVPMDRMSVVVASSVPGCIAYRGTFEGKPKSDGDMEHIRDQLGNGELLPSGRGFLMSPDCVHESVVFSKATKRLFLRIAFGD